METPELLTLKEAADRLRMSREQVRQLVLRGKIRGTREFGDWRVLASDLTTKILQAVNRPKGFEARKFA